MRQCTLFLYRDVNKFKRDNWPIIRRHLQIPVNAKRCVLSKLRTASNCLTAPRMMPIYLKESFLLNCHVIKYAKRYFPYPFASANNQNVFLICHHLDLV